MKIKLIICLLCIVALTGCKLSRVIESPDRRTSVTPTLNLQGDDASTLQPDAVTQTATSPLPTSGSDAIVSDPLDIGDRRPMLYIPGGSFLMGASSSDTNADPDEYPQHEVTLDGFWIDQYEVTNTDYAVCVQASSCNPPAELDQNGFPYEYAAEIDDAPVVNVTWNDAIAYCGWAEKRLPTEAEWERAARSDDGRIYPWGNDPDAYGKAWFCENCIFYPDHPDVRDDFSRPMPVWQLEEGASPEGIFGMAGNVWEWVWDWYAEDTYQEPDQVNPTGPEEGTYRVVRGGSWTSSLVDLRSSFRSARAPSTAWIDVGFRCVLDAPNPPSMAKTSPTNTPMPASVPTSLPFVYYPADDNSGFSISTYSFELSPDGNTLAIGANNGMITLWDTVSNKIKGTPWVHTGIVDELHWSPDGSFFASAGGDSDHGYKAIIWDAQGTRQFTLDGHTNVIGLLQWSPNGNLLASADYDGNLMIWETASGKQLAAPDERADVHGFAWSPDGLIFAAGYEDEGVVLWDTNTWKPAATIPAGAARPTNLQWSPDGTTLGFRIYQNDAYEVRYWDIRSKKVTYTLEKAYLWKWGPDGTIIVSTQYGSKPYLFQSDGELIREFGNAPDKLLGFDWSPDGRLIIAGTGKQMVIWDAKSGKILTTIDDTTLLQWNYERWSPTGDLLVLRKSEIIILMNFQETLSP